ncbi:MAG: hypothetical protein R3A47_03940 [Polyangiales bacterium]
MFCSSSTTSSVSRRPVPKCPRFSAVFLRRSVPTDTRETRNGRVARAHHVDGPGSITSVQAIYVPADDLTDPAPATTFAHFGRNHRLSRAISELGIYPAVDPLDSTSTMLDPSILGEHHCNVARRVRNASALQRLCKTSSRFSAWTNSLKTIARQSTALERFNASCRNRSSWRSSSEPRRQVRLARAEHSRL